MTMIDKTELEKLLEDERKEDARLTNLDYENECRKEREKDNPAWDMREGDYC